MSRKDNPFIERIYAEDIDRCLEFANEDAAAAVSRAVHSNSLCINPVTDFSNVPRDCTLLQVQYSTVTIMQLRVRLEGQNQCTKKVL